MAYLYSNACLIGAHSSPHEKEIRVLYLLRRIPTIPGTANTMHHIYLQTPRQTKYKTLIIRHRSLEKPNIQERHIFGYSLERSND